MTFYNFLEGNQFSIGQQVCLTRTIKASHHTKLPETLPTGTIGVITDTHDETGFHPGSYVVEFKSLNIKVGGLRDYQLENAE